jgi:hypothetical protein
MDIFHPLLIARIDPYAHDQNWVGYSCISIGTGRESFYKSSNCMVHHFGCLCQEKWWTMLLRSNCTLLRSKLYDGAESETNRRALLSSTSEHETWPQRAFFNGITGREPSDLPSWLERGHRTTATWLRLCLLISCLLKVKPVTGSREIICHRTLRNVACIYCTVLTKFTAPKIGERA